MGIEAVIWDLGGVILRTEDIAPRAALAGRLGLTREELVAQIWEGEDFRRATLGEIPEGIYWKAITSHYGLKYKEFMKDFFGGDRVDEQLLKVIRALRPRYKTALLTNSFSDLRYWIENVGKFNDAFDAMIISAEISLMKPDTAIYEYVLRQIDVRAETAVFIDDRAVNVDGARRAGLQGIQFQTREQALAELHGLLDAH